MGVDERTSDLSDTVTLIAGVLLTSVGLLALLPYVLKQGWRNRSGELAADSGYASVMAAVDAFHAEPARGAKLFQVSGHDIEELLAHLFSLRMTVSEAGAEVQEARDAIGDESAHGNGGETRSRSEDVA